MAVRLTSLRSCSKSCLIPSYLSCSLWISTMSPQACWTSSGSSESSEIRRSLFKLSFFFSFQSNLSGNPSVIKTQDKEKWHITQYLLGNTSQYFPEKNRALFHFIRSCYFYLIALISKLQWIARILDRGVVRLKKNDDWEKKINDLLYKENKFRCVYRLTGTNAFLFELLEKLSLFDQSSQFQEFVIEMGIMLAFRPLGEWNGFPSP